MNCVNEEKQARERLGAMQGVVRLAFDLRRRTLPVTHRLGATARVERALAGSGMPATSLRTDTRRIEKNISLMGRYGCKQARTA